MTSRSRLERVALLLMLACVGLWPVSARAEPQQQFDIPAGRLSIAIVELAKQARIPLGLIGEVSGATRTPAIHGRMTVKQALRRLLAGTNLSFRRTRSGDYVIVGISTQHARRAERRRPAQPTSASLGDDIMGREEIIVTASKSSSTLSSYPGSVVLLDLDGEQIASRPASGTAVLIDNLPVLAATSLGPGRNKLFARGIADGSFNGQSQANLSLYLGELRLSYAGPDPDINLFDVRRVEVLTGPYGTLYGTGALGGVMRIEANAPDAERAGGRFAAHLSDVRHGATGNEIAGMANLPLSSGRLAVRLVGYRKVDAGYIDDVARGLSNINRVTTTGGRGVLRATGDGDMEAELGFVYQRIEARDSQYSNDEHDALVTRNSVAQPYSSEFLMPSVTLRKSWGNLHLVSATGWSRQAGTELSNNFRIFTVLEQRRASFLSHETRLSGGSDRLGFVAGISLARNLVRETRKNRILDFEIEDFDLRSRTNDLALFGEIRASLSRTISATVGGRLNYIGEARRTHFDLLGPDATARFDSFSFLPSAALSWSPRQPILLFLAYRSGSRGSNLLPVPDFAAPQILISDPDRLSSFEAGWRYSAPKLSLASTISYTCWKDVQSDLITSVGNFHTNNLGNARIWGLEANGTWTPLPGLALSAALFLNNAPVFRLSPAARLQIPDHFLAARFRIPNIASASARFGLAYETSLFKGAELRLAAAMRYYGNSEAEFESRQPEYLEIGTEARLTWTRWVMTLGITNLTDVRGNRFAIGNRFTRTLDEPQSTPLQPRTLRLGFEVEF